MDTTATLERVATTGLDSIPAIDVTTVINRIVDNKDQVPPLDVAAFNSAM